MYCTIDDLLKEFNQTELEELTGYTINTTNYTDRIDAAIENASSFIDVYLYEKYHTPFSEPMPELIKIIAIDLSIYNIYENALKSTEIPKTIVWRKIEAVRLLKDLKNGELTLNNTFDYDSATNKQIIINKTQQDKFFTDDILNRYW